MGGSIKGGITYIEDDFLHLIGSLEGGASASPNVGAGVGIFWGSHRKEGKTATAEDIKGTSVSVSVPLFSIRGYQVSYGLSGNYNKKKKTIGREMLVHSINLSVDFTKFIKEFAALNLSAIKEVKKFKDKFLLGKKALESELNMGNTFLWKIPIELDGEENGKEE